jgi:hypothetical protein
MKNSSLTLMIEWGREQTQLLAAERASATLIKHSIIQAVFVECPEMYCPEK